MPAQSSAARIADPAATASAHFEACIPTRCQIGGGRPRAMIDRSLNLAAS